LTKTNESDTTDFDTKTTIWIFAFGNGLLLLTMLPDDGV